MGTRNLICAVIDGDFKFANYCQWDGYLEGQGKTIIDFIQNTLDVPKFKKALRACNWMTDRQVRNTWKKCGADPKSESGFVSMEIAEKHTKLYPALSRDTGAKILALIQNEGVRKLQDSRDFAKDSLFCEFAYVLDMDKELLEIYAGANHGINEGRFPNLHLLAELTFKECKEPDVMEKLLNHQKECFA